MRNVEGGKRRGTEGEREKSKRKKGERTIGAEEGDLRLAGRGRVAWCDENYGDMDLPPQIRDRLDALGVLAGDVTETFTKGTGAGGQKINKTSSTVVLRHGPTGTEVRCQEERSQAANRARAWERFCEKLEERVKVAEAARQAVVAKARRLGRKRSARQKAILVEAKRRRGEVKQARRPASGGGDL
jgi:protein subunit release factor B